MNKYLSQKTNRLQNRMNTRKERTRLPRVRSFLAERFQRKFIIEIKRANPILYRCALFAK